MICKQLHKFRIEDETLKLEEIRIWVMLTEAELLKICLKKRVIDFRRHSHIL